MINSNLYIPEIDSLYSKEVNCIIDRYCHIIKRGFYTGEELSNIIKKYYPENIEDINFTKEHIRYIDKSLLTYFWCVKI